MICALIMAGGVGTRFWPLSTEERPKQFLNLIGKDTMIQMTVKRLLGIIPMERIFISTGEKYVSLVKEQLPELSERNIIVEPEGRNTAPSIALSSMLINRYYRNSSVIVLPSDHLINQEDKFRKLINQYDKFLDSNNEGIITFGIKPTRAEVGYGYIKVNDKEVTENNLVKVKKFVEKPNKKLADEYYKSGEYLWNSGIFMWRVSYIIEKIKEYLPNTYEALNDIETVKEEFIQDIINKNYQYTDKISIDYGILEKDNNIFVVPCDIGWDDIGTWEALDRYREKDESGNIGSVQIDAIDSKNNIVFTDNKEVVIDKLNGIYIIESKDKIYIGKKSNISNLKKYRYNMV